MWTDESRIRFALESISEQMDSALRTLARKSISLERYDSQYMMIEKGFNLTVAGTTQIATFAANRIFLEISLQNSATFCQLTTFSSFTGINVGSILSDTQPPLDYDSKSHPSLVTAAWLGRAVGGPCPVTVRQILYQPGSED